MLSLAQAHKGFAADELLQGRFDDTIAGFVDLVEASTHDPCVKRAWVEFLGERPTPPSTGSTAEPWTATPFTTVRS